MSSPKISVCIPVYNVEPYLRQCLDSVVNQTFKDFEVIIVNDASPDNCAEIIRHYIKTDKRVRVFDHKKNLGPNAARETALKHARGEYISFVDSDDRVDTTFLEKLYSQAIRQNAEVVLCNIKMLYPDGNREIALQLQQKFSPPFFLHLTQTKLSVSLCNKLWRKNLFEKPGIDFTNIFLGEDTVLSTRLFYYVKQLGIVDEPLYHYRVGYEKPNSTDATIKEQKLIENLNGEFLLHQQLLDFFIPKGLDNEIRNVLAQRQKQFLLYGEEVLRLKSNQGRVLLKKLLYKFHGSDSIYPIDPIKIWFKSRALYWLKNILPKKIFIKIKSFYIKYSN